MFSLIKGPGWRPGSPWTGNIDDVPKMVNTNNTKLNIKEEYLIFIF